MTKPWWQSSEHRMRVCFDIAPSEICDLQDINGAKLKYKIYCIVTQIKPAIVVGFRLAIASTMWPLIWPVMWSLMWSFIKSVMWSFIQSVMWSFIQSVMWSFMWPVMWWGRLLLGVQSWWGRIARRGGGCVYCLGEAVTPEKGDGVLHGMLTSFFLYNNQHAGYFNSNQWWTNKHYMQVSTKRKTKTVSIIIVLVNLPS